MTEPGLDAVLAAHTAAVQNRLQTAVPALGVGLGEGVPDATRYAVLSTFSRNVPAAITDPARTQLWFTAVLICVGSGYSQAEWVAGKVRGALLGHQLVVDGRDLNCPEHDSSPLVPDDTGPVRTFSCTETFRYLSVPA